MSCFFTETRRGKLKLKFKATVPVHSSSEKIKKRTAQTKDEFDLEENYKDLKKQKILPKLKGTQTWRPFFKNVLNLEKNKFNNKILYFHS